MDRNLIVYSGVSAAIIGSFVLCTWELNRRAEELVTRMDAMAREVATVKGDVCALEQEAKIPCQFDLSTARPVTPPTAEEIASCEATTPGPWCKDPIVRNAPQ